MNNFRALKYLMTFTGPLVGIVALTSYGWLTFLPLLYVFALVPVLEFFFPASTYNMSKMEEEVAKNDRLYDFVIYAFVPVQYGFLLLFLLTINDPALTTFDLTGRIVSMGIMCGALGINIAHELGHRKTWYEQLMSKALLLSSLYMHFFIEHNRGHHKNVSTPEDPASSRYGEIIYTFYLRSVYGSYMSAWHLESSRLRKEGKAILSVHNEMLWYHLIQIAFVAAIYFVFGTLACLAFVIAAIIGFLLLETVNYIEHYGLQREQKGERYERVKPHHSWNSNHLIGRLLLFELSRHSDHHYISSRKYQVLRHHENSPQMPTGYPGMMVLSLFPPLWFMVMHPHIKKLKAQKVI